MTTIEIDTKLLPRCLRLCQSSEGELYLYHEFIKGSDLGQTWMGILRACLDKKAPQSCQIVSQRPLAQALLEMTQRILVPQADNFTPPSRTPWGGREIIRQFKKHLDIQHSPIVGESWELSGHPSFPNCFPLAFGGAILQVPIFVLEQLSPENLYGKKALSLNHSQAPFLLKLLNSGSWLEELKELRQLLPGEFQEEGLSYHEIHQRLSELAPSHPQIAVLHQNMLKKNLSIQLHPTSPESSKAEAWMILDAEPGAGVYLGFKEGISPGDFKKTMESGRDLSSMMQFQSVTAGDVFVIPPGTLHAIGAGVLLVEPQESSDITYRAYDWGRLHEGQPRSLHKKEVFRWINWDLPQGEKGIKSLRVRSSERGPLNKVGSPHPFVEPIVRRPEFQLHRIALPYKGHFGSSMTTRKGLQGGFVLEGEVQIVTSTRTHERSCIIPKGRSFLLPVALGDYRFCARQSPSVLLLMQA